jgi:hypothetical protein
MMRTLPEILLGLCLVGCSNGTDPGADATRVGSDERVRELVASSTSGALEASSVIASVNGSSILAGELVTYLQVFPALTPEAALQDLIDLRLAAASARESLTNAPQLANDGRVMGRAMHWLQREVWANSDAVSEEGSSEVLNEPGYTAIFGNPELRRASHVLMMFLPESTDADKDWALNRLGEIRQELLQRGEVWPVDLKEVVGAYVEEAAGHRINFIYDLHMTFPRRYSGPARWGGLDAVVDEFGDAAFDPAASEGDLLGPVQTQFGHHLILLEQKYDPELLPYPERVEIARDFVHTQAMVGIFSERTQALIQRMDLIMDYDILNLLAQSPDERMAMEQQLRTERYDD